MTEDSQQRNEDAALGKVVRKQRDRNHVKYSIDQLADQMADVAKFLKQGRTDIEPNAIEWLNETPLRRLWDDLEKAQQEVYEAEQQAGKLGVTLP